MNLNARKQDYRGNLLSQILFTWLEKFFWNGFRKKINQNDLNPCPSEQESEKLYESFDKHWKNEIKKNAKADLKIALAKTLKTPLCVGGIAHLVEGLLLLAQAILIYYFSSLRVGNSVNSTTIPNTIHIGYAFSISLITLFVTINNSIANYLLNCVSIQMRTLCITAIFKKSLQIPQVLLHQISIGHIINLVSNDVFKFDIGILYWDYLWIGPIIAVLSLIIILCYIGPIGLVGVSYIIIHAPLQLFLGYVFGVLRLKQSVTADKRIRLIDQIIRGMRVIKCYVWEASFVKYVSKIRKKEICFASMSGITQSTNFSFFSTSLFIALFLIYVTSYEIGKPVNASQLGLAFIVLNTMRSFLILFWGQSVFVTREIAIALKRIQRILQIPERDGPFSKNSRGHIPSIQFNNFTASWKQTEKIVSEGVTLQSINILLNQVQFVAITGPIGSGKSSLLLSLIGELPGISGNVSKTGVISYAPQLPWIFSGTIRDNILVGHPLNLKRYEQVLEVCCLREDVECFDNGDVTLIGERGLTLSGGQKARVSLARSVYHQADVYLFDDPLSAVDVKVGRDIFEKCINTFLKAKLVLLVTHQIQYVRKADHIIVMDEGKVVASGNYQKVAGNEFSRAFLQGLDDTHYSSRTQEVPSIRLTDSLLEGEQTNKNTDEDITEVEMETTQPLTIAMSDEDYRPTSSSVLGYVRYFLTGGFGATIVLLVLTILSNGGLILAYWWMQSITQCLLTANMNSSEGNNATLLFPISTDCPWYFNFYKVGSLRLLAAFTFSGCIFTFLRGINFYYIVLQASRRLHAEMLRRVMYTPIRFFEANPSGRILNRFAKDFGFLDEQLPMLFYDFWQYSTYNLAIVLASCLVQYYLLLPFGLLLVGTLLLRYWYLKTCTQVKRLESIARSPLYSHISLTLQGLTTIRCLNLEKTVTRDFHHFQDEHSRAWYHYVACNKWFSLRVDVLTALVVIFAVFSTIVSRQFLGRNELIEFSIPLILSLPTSLQYVVKISGDVDIQMVSVDRILNYCKLRQEKSKKSTPKKTCNTAKLKHEGKIRYNDVCFKYAKDLPFTLHAVSLDITPGEKIGIIGRTGAGKSSLFNSLFLLNELSAGSITVDDEDISSLNLYEHRKRLSVIPQDPFLFSGTLRDNLDPFEEFSSEEIWDALAKSHLQNMVQSLPDQLAASVEEDGLNFSTGERQLLCLARAILRKNKIILIDEATANVDIRTDILVQQAIRTHFSDCTVVTIAHRIETIIDSDRIIVLEKGRVLDFEAPNSMLQRENSYLSLLLTQLDISTQKQLRNTAEMNYSKI